jgi:hypothetical protein
VSLEEIISSLDSFCEVSGVSSNSFSQTAHLFLGPFQMPTSKAFWFVLCYLMLFPLFPTHPVPFWKKTHMPERHHCDNSITVFSRCGQGSSGRRCASSTHTIPQHHGLTRASSKKCHPVMREVKRTCALGMIIGHLCVETEKQKTIREKQILF